MSAIVLAGPDQLWTFYSPDSPEEGIKIGARVDPVRFAAGVLVTDDPAVAEGVRAANRGHYYEADLPVALTCDICGGDWFNKTAFTRHIRRCGDKTPR